MRIGNLILLSSLVSFSAFARECSLEPLTSGVRLQVKEGSTQVYKRTFLNIRDAVRERDTMVREGECSQAKIQYRCLGSTDSERHQIQFHRPDMSISIALQYSGKDDASKALTDFLDAGICRLGQYEVCKLNEEGLFIQIGQNRNETKMYFGDLVSAQEKYNFLVESGLCAVDESKNECQLDVQEGFIVMMKSGPGKSMIPVDGIKEGMEQLTQMENEGQCKVKKANYECSTYSEDGLQIINIKNGQSSSYEMVLIDDTNINDFLTSGLCRSVSEKAAKSGLMK